MPIEICGIVTDEAGRPAPGVLIEVWAANRHGKYDHPADTSDEPLDPNFKGYGRALTAADGSYRFVSIKPGAYPNPGYAPEWFRPPHVHFSVYAAGVMQRLITQMYFPGEELNEIDRDIDTLVRGSPVWRAKEELLASVPGIGKTLARTFLAELPDKSLFAALPLRAAIYCL